jgi:sporulation protein YlmC with PRC-barrel domain
MRLELGTPVHCTDEQLGALADVVIDPVSKRLTHLVVSIHGRPGPARLVPMDMVSTDPEERLCVGCTVGEAARLEAVQDFAYLRMGDFPVSDPKWDVGVENVLAMPYYPMSDMTGNALAYDDHVSVSFDRVPKGEVEIRRTSTVMGSDGKRIGHVEGFVLADDEHITHILVEHRHLLRRRRTMIPIGAVEKVETDSVTVRLTSADVTSL